MENVNKFKEMVHYICHKCPDPKLLGAIKLNKVAWFSDVISYLENGRSLTNERYVKQKFGPVPKSILPVLRDLQREGRIAISDVEFYGKTKRQFTSLSEPRADVFTAQDLKVLDQVLDAVCRNHTASSISDLTHDDIWKLAATGEEIPLHAILASELAEVTDEDVERVLERLEEKAA